MRPRAAVRAARRARLGGGGGGGDGADLVVGEAAEGEGERDQLEVHPGPLPGRLRALILYYCYITYTTRF